jgi:glycosyltransferase involved in cell wall biosynthesis
MIIAVNTVNAGYPDDNGFFLMDCFFGLAQQLPQHQFIFIATTPVNEKYLSQKNITAVSAASKITNPLHLQYWLRFKLPAILKKNKASLLVSAGYCSLNSKLPQLLFINDLSFLQHPQFYTKSWLAFYKKNMPQFLKKTTSILTVSEFLKKECIAAYKESIAKTTVCYPAIETDFKPVNHWQQKESVKDKFTDGKEYFLYTGRIHTNKNIINLLKAFSFFKQRQKSNMQLILASVFPAENKLVQTLSSYKYKKEVVVIDNLSIPALATLTAAAYAFVYPVFYDGIGSEPLQAIHCGVPVIAADNTVLPEILGNAALYCNPDDFNDIADKMMYLFKNEEERNLLIIKGREQVQKTAALKSTNIAGKLIEKIIEADTLKQ